MKNLTSEEFFNITAGFYDNMVSFADAVEKRKHSLGLFLTPDMKAAADLGSGTGVDSIALYKSGLSVTGFDISEEMIRKAERNAKRASCNIDFFKYPLDEIPGLFHDSFDIVVSAGNTLANIPPDQLVKVFDNVFRMLKPGGSFLFQILNYTLILKENKRIVNITGTGGDYFIRFYDFLADHLNFNILRFNAKDHSDQELISTQVYAHSVESLNNKLIDAGFPDINEFSGFNRIGFKVENSKDLVVLAVKPDL